MNKEEIDWSETIYEWGIVIKGTHNEIETVKKQLSAIISQELVKFQRTSPSHLKLVEY